MAPNDTAALPPLQGAGRPVLRAVAVGVLALFATACAGEEGKNAASPAAGHAPTLFVSTDGSDDSSCRRASPCLTLDQAYRVARSGDVVDVAPGTYGAETIEANPDRTLEHRVVFAAREPGAAVFENGLEIYGSHIELRGLTVAGDLYVKREARDVVVRGLEAEQVFVTGAADVAILGGSLGPVVDADLMQIKPYEEGAAPPVRILVDGVLFRDASKSSGSGAHVDCLQVMGVRGLTVRRSRFTGCEARDIILSNDFAPSRDVQIENNFLGPTNAHYTLHVGLECSNVVVRNNSAGQAFYPSRCADAVFLANVVTTSNCSSSASRWNYNVFGEGAPCGPGDSIAPTGFRNPEALDYRLEPGAAAIDHGDPTSFPPDDIDGRRRPLGEGPDAGASEAR
jgi:hypothetical protein